MRMVHTPKRHEPSVLLRLALAGVLLISTLLFSGPPIYAAPPTPGDFQTVQLPPEALSAPVLLGAPTAGSTTGSAKMESALVQVASSARISSPGALAAAESGQLRVSGERVQVLITTTAGRADAAAQVVAQAGGEVTGRGNRDRWLQAWVPVTELAGVAADASIDYVRRPGEAVTMATTEGAAVINAPAWNAAGKTGAGVRVAVIDAGFVGYPNLLGGDLPTNVTVKNFVDGETDSQANGTTEHGTACAEVIHDIAPGASLYLAKVNTDLDLEEAVNWAKAQGVNIISTSLGWYNITPGDGTGFFADVVQSARNAGIFWATAASNDRQAHWGGAFNGNASGYHQFEGTQIVDFFGPGDGNAYLIPAGYPIRVWLRWDDWSAKNQDYDLYVVRYTSSGWSIVGSSVDRQTGGSAQTPTEFVAVTTSGSDAPYGIAIKRYSSSRNVNLELFAPKVTRLDKVVTARSLGNLADAPAAMTVAALDVNAPYPQESYSSEGPTNGPGGTATGGAVKPDISGFANVSTSSYPNPTAKFNGTSSATPHVAGAAALVKSAFPAYTPAQIQSFLEGRAIDMGSAGKDTLYGWGRLYLGAAPGAAPTHRLYTPLVLRPVSPPTLNDINNAAGQANYIVSWSLVAGATGYQLEEANSNVFSPATQVYNGSGTSWQATGKAPGTYCYRVKASTASSTSAWSNVQCTTVDTGGDPIVNGSFEAGATGWEQSSLHDPNLIINSGFPGSITPHGGSWAAWLGGWYDEVSYVRQQVTVPASRPYLVYWHWLASGETACGSDLGKVVINDTVPVDTYNLCSGTNTNGWVRHAVNLGSYAGQPVSIQIRAETNSTLNSNLFVDDVSFSATAGGAPGQTTPLGAFTVDSAAAAAPKPGALMPH